LYDKNPTVIYGPGDSLKSLFGLFCGMLLASGVSTAGLACSPEPRHVLFLDWEMSVEDLRGRVKLLQTANPCLKATPDYRRCYQPFARDIENLRTIVSAGEYEILILDSLAMAAGGEDLKESSSAIEFNAALRSLNCTSLVIGHTPKPQEDDKERMLYGSVFFHNLSRVAWEVRREGQAIGLYQRKNNLGPRHDPLGFRFRIDEHQCLISATDLHEEPTLATGLPLQERLAGALKKEGKQTVQDLAHLLDVKQPTVRTMLNRYKNRFISCDGYWECLA